MKQGLSTDFSIYGIMLALRKFGVWEVFRLVLHNLYCTWRILPEAHLYPVNFPSWMRSITGMLLREIYITMRPTSNPKNLGGRGKWITVSSSQGQPGLQSEFQDKTVQKKKVMALVRLLYGFIAIIRIMERRETVIFTIIRSRLATSCWIIGRNKMKVEIIPQSVYSESHMESYEMVKKLVLCLR